MRFLILGAGATGGYFGARLAAAGADVTFLVRDRRRGQLAARGLTVKSGFGDFNAQVKTITQSDDLKGYDIVMLSCKAYDLEAAIDAIRPAVGAQTLVLPLLNGIKHLDALDAAFGRERVLGGSCHLSVTLDAEGTIHHLNKLHLLTFGPREPGQAASCKTLLGIFQAANFDTKLRDDVMQAMWDKWVLLASLASLTCLFRASVGDIASAAGGRDLMLAQIEECRAVAAANGYEPSDEHMKTIGSLLTDPASPVVASMLRDMQKGSRIEADLIIGDMLARGRAKGIATPLLAIANTNVLCYESQRLLAASAGA